MEKLLEKLGATQNLIGPETDKDLTLVTMAKTWRLKRRDVCLNVSRLRPWEEDILIGEITEALREKGWDEFRATYYTLGNAALIIRSHENRMQEPVFECDEGILACYIKAGEELL